jgi:hypothetical protein
MLSILYQLHLGSVSARFRLSVCLGGRIKYGVTLHLRVAQTGGRSVLASMHIFFELYHTLQALLLFVIWVSLFVIQLVPVALAGHGL